MILCVSVIKKRQGYILLVTVHMYNLQPVCTLYFIFPVIAFSNNAMFLVVAAGASLRHKRKNPKRRSDALCSCHATLGDWILCQNG